VGVPVPAALRLYVIWVNYGCGADIARSRASLLAQSATVPGLSLNFICVNNGPGDGRSENLADGMTVLEMGENAGFGRACNRGIRWVADRDRAAAVWLLNPDTEVAAGCLAAIARTLATDGQWRTDWAICGTTVLTPNGEIWQTGGHWNHRTGSILPSRDRPPDPNNDPKVHSPQDTDWVSGCSLLMNLGHFGDDIPQFDPNFFLYYEDFDLCQRQRRAGHPVQWLPAATVIHHPSSVTGRTPYRRLRWSLYGYWLALEKHAPRSVLMGRLLRTAIAIPPTALGDWPTAIAKATAISDYLRHRVQKIRKSFAPRSPKKIP
jgi:N-acetylglucosaminyl-diphospho-decaprenol L-rhamnosyltransferase